MTTFDTRGELLEIGSNASTLAQPGVTETELAREAPHTTLDADSQCIEGWLEQGTPKFLHLYPIELEDLEKLWIQLQNKGIKPRYDWLGATKTAVFRMPFDIHECPKAWLNNHYVWLTEQLRSVAQCGKPTVRSYGNAVLTLPGFGLACPSNRLDLDLDFEGDNHIPILYPRVVLETGYSETRDWVLKKTWNYLFHSEKHVHAVIVCETANQVSKQEDFWASISVWKRAETGDIDEDWPFEAIEDVDHEPLRGEELGLTAEALGESQALDTHPSLVSSSEMRMTGNGATVEADRYQPNCFNGESRHMVRRWGPVYVIDERSGKKSAVDSTESFELPLEVYDFLRVCPQHEQLIIPNNVLLLPLDTLREYFVSALRQMRSRMQSDRERTEESNVSAQPTPGLKTTRSLPPGINMTKKVRYG
ncbi:hypothetical protein FRC08_012814 [Ceratobasidium sp. 394]|nr:hypothetical protein FRC08_012814 [Ceratobasidium sp. 394]